MYFSLIFSAEGALKNDTCKLNNMTLLMILLFRLKYSMCAMLLVATVIFLGGAYGLIRLGEIVVRRPKQAFSKRQPPHVIVAIVYLALAGIVLALLPVGIRRIRVVTIVVLPIRWEFSRLQRLYVRML